MRHLIMAWVWCACALAWAGDGECRLFYAGNFAAGAGEQHARLAGELAALQAQSAADGVPAVVLLPGNLCSPDQTTLSRDASALALAAALQPAAVALGMHDMKHGPEYLRSRTAQAPLPWVSANLSPRGVASVPQRVLRVGTVRLGVIGVTLAPGDLPEKALREELARQIKRLRRQSDILVLLGAFDMLQAPILATLYPEIDLVLACAGESAPQALGRTLCAPGDAELPYYGQLELAARDGRLVAWRGEMRAVAPVAAQ